VCGDLQRCMDMLLMALQLRMQLAVLHAPRTHSSSRPLIAHAALYRIAWRLSAQSMILRLGEGKLHVRMPPCEISPVVPACAACASSCVD